MLIYDAGMTDLLPDETVTPVVSACGVCHALTYNLEAHAGYHTAVANADPIVLLDNIPAAVD